MMRFFSSTLRTVNFEFILFFLGGIFGGGMHLK